jgi:hypothetical protein
LRLAPISKAATDARAKDPAARWIIDEPEVDFVLDAQITVPDIAD